MPIQDLKARFTQDKFEVLAVNVGESKERVEAFLNKVPVIFFHPVRSAGRCFPELEGARLPHDIHPGPGWPHPLLPCWRSRLGLRKSLLIK